MTYSYGKVYVSDYIQIDTFTYSTITSNGLNASYVRFDSTACKVYYRQKTTDTDRILYDYTLKLGDTVTRPKAMYYTNPIQHVVTKVDSVMINNVPHKRLYFQVVDPMQASEPYVKDYEIIEGIGCTRALLLPLTGYIFTNAGHYIEGLTCFKNNGISPYAPYSACSPQQLGTGGNLTTNSSIKIYPQPAIGLVNICLPEGLSSGIFYIISTMGQVIAEQSFNNTSTIKYSNSSLHGLYYYKIAGSDNSYHYTGRLLFE